MISFSGIDCSGKSTQIDLLCKELDKTGKKYLVVWSRGGYTPGIEFVKKIFRHGKQMTKEERVAYSEKTSSHPIKRKVLFVVGLIDLWFFYSFTIRIKELFGKIVICDRYIWDTYIDYKMRYSEYDFERNFWWKLTLKTMRKPEPSFVFFIPAEESMRRSLLKDEPFPEPIEVRKERIQWYIDESLDNRRWQYIIDATKSIEDVFSEVKEKLNLE